MTDKSKTSTTLSFRCPQDMLEAIDSIGREHYPTDKNSKTNSGCDRSKTLFHIIQAGIAALTDGDIQIEVRQQSKTDSKTAIDQGELEELVKKLIGENLPVIQPRLTDDNRYVRRCELDQKIDDRIVKALGEDGLFFDSAANDLAKEAIARSYSQATTNLNSTRDDFYSKVEELQNQLQELQSIPPAPVPQPQINEERTTDNGELLIVNCPLSEQETGNREQGTGEHEDVDQVDSENKSDTQSPIADEEQAEKNRQSHQEYVGKYLTPKPEKQRLDPAIYTRNYQIVSMLDCQFWMDGKKFSNQELKDNEIDKNITTNKAEIETLLGAIIKTKNSVIQRFVGILKAMGFELKGNPKDGYYITNPEIFN
jgi:hypothetical protein